MKKFILLLFLFLFVLVACTNSASLPPNFCKIDADCICGGIDKSTKNCFVGNKNYAKVNVDMSKVCPDFCTGIAGNLITKCVDNKCMNVNKNNFPECNVAADCVPSDCCHASACVPKTNVPKCEKIFCSQECKTGTLDCGGFCACEYHRCTTKNLFVQSSDTPVV